MAEYYFISQLPSLDGIGENSPLPITEERFVELCRRFSKKKVQDAMNDLTLSPPKQGQPTGKKLLDAWNESERNLRLALGKARAEKMKKPFATERRNLPTEYLKTANAAMEIENPMEAEKYLNRFRLELLEILRPVDSFSEDYLFYYGLRLKLLLRIRQFDRVAGEQAYRTIYHSIRNGDSLEAIE